MPRKSKTVKQKAASIAKARAFRHPSQISDSVLVPDPEMNNTTMPEMTPSPGLEIIRDLDNEEINEEITLEGSWDHLDLSETKINLYFEFEFEDEQGYVREGEELEDIYEDGELSELEGEEWEKSLKLVMEDEMERKALESVQLSTIWKWEHRMIRWMEAYRDGKSAKDAQFDVKKYGSRQYTSHCKASESVAR